MILYRKIIPVVILFISCTALFAQVKQEPKERTISIEEPIIFKDSLPKISLPDFVITGKEKIDITDRSKIDFNEIRIYSRSKNLAPSFEVKDLSASISETPLKKINTDGEYSDSFMGFVKAEYGNFNSPAFSAGTAYGWNIFKAALTGSYISRNENINNSDFSKGNVNLSFEADIPKTDNIFNEAIIKLDLDFYSKSYHYYGISNDYYPFNVGIDEPVPDAGKLSSFTVKSSITSQDSKYYNYNVNLLWNRFGNKVGSFKYFPERVENKFIFDISGDYKYDKYLFDAKIYLNNNNISSNSYNFQDEKENSFLCGIFLGAETEFMPSFIARAGLKYYSYNFVLFSPNTSNGSIILPQLSVRYENHKNLALSLCYAPDLENMSLEKIYSMNPYISPDELKHTVNNVNIFVLLDYAYSNNLRIKTTLGYIEQDNTPILEPAIYWYSGLPYRYWLTNSDIYRNSANGIYAKLQIDYSINSANNLCLKLSYQDKEIEGHRIPYDPAYYVSLDYRSRLNNGLELNPSFDLIGSRSSRYGILDMDPIFLLNLNMEYPIFHNLIASVNINNILNTRYSYYRDYEEYPFSIFGGIKFKW